MNVPLGSWGRQRNIVPTSDYEWISAVVFQKVSKWFTSLCIKTKHCEIHSSWWNEFRFRRSRSKLPGSDCGLINGCSLSSANPGLPPGKSQTKVIIRSPI